MKRNLPEICSVRCPVGEGESWDGSSPEQEGAVGSCSLLGFWGAEQLSVTPALPGAFWTPQMDLGSVVQEMGAGLGGDNPLNPSSVRLPCRFGVL